MPTLDTDIQQPRPRASSGTSLGLSSGYQSEEDPEENCEFSNFSFSFVLSSVITWVLSVEYFVIPRFIDIAPLVILRFGD